jgi:hypothetical protein
MRRWKNWARCFQNSTEIESGMSNALLDFLRVSSAGIEGEYRQDCARGRAWFRRNWIATTVREFPNG